MGGRPSTSESRFNKLGESWLRSILLVLFLTLISIPSQTQIRIDRYLMTGRQQLSQSQFSEALETFSHIIRIQEDNWEAWYYRGLTKFYLGDEVGSESDFDRAISIQSNMADLYLYRGIVRDFRRNHYGALEDFNKGIVLKHDDPVLHYSRGTTYLRLNNFTRSIEDFDIAIKKDPRMHNAYLNRGIARAKMLNREGAFSDFNEAIILNPFSGEGHQRKGLLFYESEDYQEALVCFSQAIQKDSSNSRSWYARALTWYEAERKDSCLSDLSMVITLDPLHSVALYNRALVLSQMEDYEGAIADYHRVNELHPNHVLTYFNRGILRQQTGDMPGALADLSEAIRLYPDFAKAYMARSSMYRTLGRVEDAQTDILIAQEKIQANQGRSQEELALNYADTTIQFEELISLNSQFVRSFSQIVEGVEDKQLDPLGFVTLNIQGELEIEEGEGLSEYQLLRVSLDYPSFDPKVIMDMPEIEEAKKLAEQKLFNEAIILLTEKISAVENKGPALLMRAKVRYEMIVFVMQTGVLNEVVPLQMGSGIGAAVGANDFTTQVDYSEVEDDFTALLTLCPEMSVAWYNRALIRLYARDFLGAEEDLSHALELDPQFAGAWYNRGILRLYADEKKQEIRGDRDAACLDLSRAGEMGIEKAYGVIGIMCGKD